MRKASPVDQHIGRRLRRRRLDLGLSQAALSEMIGVTFQQVQKYEAADNRIAASTLYRLAEALEVSPEYFFEGLQREKALS